MSNILLSGMFYKNTITVNKDYVFANENNRHIIIKTEDLGIYTTGYNTDNIIVTDEFDNIINIRVLSDDPINYSGRFAFPIDYSTTENKTYNIYWGHSGYAFDQNYTFENTCKSFLDFSNNPVFGVYDYASDMYTLTPVGSWSLSDLVDADFGKSFKFDQTVKFLKDDNVSEHADVGFNSTLDFTVIQRFKMSTIAGAYHILSAGFYGWDWSINIAGGKFGFYFSNTSYTAESEMQAITPLPNIWYTYAISYKASTKEIKFILNGNVILTRTTPNPTYNTNAHTIGNETSYGSPANCYVSNFSLYQEVLSPEVIKTMYNNIDNYNNFITFGTVSEIYIKCASLYKINYNNRFGKKILRTNSGESYFENTNKSYLLDNTYFEFNYKSSKVQNITLLEIQDLITNKYITAKIDNNGQIIIQSDGYIFYGNKLIDFNNKLKQLTIKYNFDELSNIVPIFKVYYKEEGDFSYKIIDFVKSVESPITISSTYLRVFKNCSLDIGSFKIFYEVQ